MSVKLFSLLAICLYIATQTKALGQEITNNLTDDQIRRIFHRSRNELPSYKTIRMQTLPAHRSKREVRPAEFEIDGEKIGLNLKPTEHDVMYRQVPVWTVKTDYSTGGHSYEKVGPEESTIDGVFYEDPKTMATMLAYYKNGYIYYDGVFGESKKTKVIKSVVEKWSQESGKNVEDDHIIFDAEENQKDTEALGENDVHPGAEKLDKPLSILYPKILMVVTYDYFKTLGEDVAETVKYVATLWNAINLKYSKLTSPQVKIVITGIIIAKDETALRFFYDNKKQNEERQFNHIPMMMSQSDYFVNTFPKKVNFKNYDVTMVMTTFGNGGVVGSAYVGHICRKDLNVGFVMDDGSFSSLQSGTHELGHLLNLPHDGMGKAASCENYPEDNVSTIMAPFVTSVEKYVWSKCSKDILHKFAQTKAAECLRNPIKM